MLELADLQQKTVDELRKIASEMKLTGASLLNKRDLCMRILVKQSEANGHEFRWGILDIVNGDRGYLRGLDYEPNPSSDIYVADTQIKRFNLRTGDMVSGPVRPPKDAERYWSLLRVQSINGMPPETARTRPHSEDLTPAYPDQRL